MKNILVSALLITFAPIVAADTTLTNNIKDKVETATEKAKRCTVKDTASLYYTDRLKNTDDAGKMQQEKVNILTKIAKENNIEGFQILSQDVSVGRGCCSNGDSEISLSFSLTYKADYNVLTILTKESGSANVSTSRYTPLDCD